MRSILQRLERMPAWLTMVLGIALYSIVGIGGALANLVGNSGGLQLAQIASSALFIALLLLWARRRQYDAWSSGVQLAVVIFSAAWISILVLKGLVPTLFESQTVFGPGLAATVIVGPIMAGLLALIISTTRRFSPRSSSETEAARSVRSNEEL